MANVRFVQERRRWLVRWRVKIRHGVQAGDYVSGSKTFQKKDLALLFKKQIEEKEDAWAAGLDASPKLLIDAQKEWEVHIKQLTARTQELYKSTLEKFLDKLPKHVKSIKYLKATHIRKYITEYLATGVKHRTANIQLEAIKSFCNFMQDHYEVANPAKEIKALKEDPPDHRFLTDEEYETIIKHADNHIDEVLFLSNTGLRATEYCNVRWRDISKDMKSLTLLGKGRKRRTIPLNATCRDIITKRKEQPHKLNDYIFLSKSDTQTSRHMLNKHCATIAKRAGVLVFGPHALRHYFATNLLLKNVSIQIVSKLLGHSSIAITEKTYIHILPDHLAGATDVIG